jgi:hypothetical protein
MSQEPLIAGIHEQKTKLINVLGVVQCMQSAVRDDEPPMELEGAIELLGEEVQRVINGLEALWSSASSDRRGTATSSEETQS